MAYEFYEVNGRKCIRAPIQFTFAERADSWLGGKVDLYTWTCPWCGKYQKAGIPYIHDQPPKEPHAGPIYDYCQDCLQGWRWNPNLMTYQARFDPLDEEGIAIRRRLRAEYQQAVAEGRGDEYRAEHWR